MLILVIAPLQGKIFHRSVGYKSIFRVLTGDIFSQYSWQCNMTARFEPVVYEELNLPVSRQLRVTLPQLDLKEAGHEEGESYKEAACHYPLEGGGQHSELA